MALLGIDASISFGAASSVSSSGIKDLTISVNSKTVDVESRGFDWVRTLRGQKELSLSFAVEADAPCVATLRAAFWASPGSTSEKVPTTITDAVGDSIAGNFVVTKFEAVCPVGGEAEYQVEMKVAASASTEDQPTHTASTTSGT